MIKYGKGSLILTFEIENGRLASAVCAGRELLAEGEKPALIRARFRDAAGRAFDVDTSEASCCVTKAGEGYLHAAYSDFARAGISLTLAVRESDDGALLFRAEAGCGPDLAAEWLEYPRLTMKNNLKGNGGDGAILWPYNEALFPKQLKAVWPEYCGRFNPSAHDGKGHEAAG